MHLITETHVALAFARVSVESLILTGRSISGKVRNVFHKEAFTTLNAGRHSRFDGDRAGGAYDHIHSSTPVEGIVF